MGKSYLESHLGQNEEILLASRQHWFILASAILLECVGILILLAVTVTASIYFVSYILIIVVIGFILILIPMASMTHDILKWTNQQYIITNRRVLQIYGIMNKDVTDSSLEKVNDVKMTQSVFGRIFDYGDIEILTASELGANLIKRIEDPIHFKTTMLDAKERMGNASLSEFEDYGQEKRSIPTIIAQLDGLRRQGILTEEEFQQKKSELLNRIN